MSNKRHGRYVQSKGGLTGMIYTDEKPVNGKLILHVTEGFNPVFYNGQPKKVLCNPEDLTVQGFFS